MPRRGGRGSSLRLATLAGAALLLLACSRAPTPQASHAPAPKPKATSGKVQNNVDADLVSSVGAGPGPAPISVKFRLGKRPQLGVPLQIVLTITPTADAQIGHLHGSFQPDSGLNLQGEHSIDASDLRAGEALERQLTVVPEQSGVLNLNATFTLDLGSGSVSRSFAIPVIVSDNSS